MKPVIQFKQVRKLLLIPLMLSCFGLAPMAQAVGPDTEGNIPGSNNGEGIGVLVSRTGGIWNTGTGFEALNHVTAGNQNTATGLRALFSDTNGGFNTATGVYSLFSNTSGFFNSTTGAYSLANNTTGLRNTANGASALLGNTTGNDNTANGAFALSSNTTGVVNTANGFNALFNNVTGSQNTANGASALGSNISGDGNIALGVNAGNNIGTANNVISIGHSGADVSDTCYIGHIRGVTTGQMNAVPVVIDSFGQLGTVSSSRRFKKEIKAMDKASEDILSLKPVTFQFRSDASGTPQFGLIAEEVAAVNPDLIARDEKGEIYTVRYDAVNAMSLNEFLKEHRKVEELQATVAQQRKDFQAAIAHERKDFEAVVAQLKEQAAQIHKVSAQLEMSKPAPKVVVNKP